MFMNWIRINFESVVIATFAHAFYNFFFQTFWFTLLFRPAGANVKYWEILGGDMGVFPMILFYLLIVFGLYKLKLRLKVSTI